MFNGSSWKKWVLPSSVLVDGAWVGFYSKVEILSSRFLCLLLQAAQSWGNLIFPKTVFSVWLLGWPRRFIVLLTSPWLCH